eukprot:COSAG01_NODE_5281_length_4359_cov_1.386620_3_plen_891_part_00
MRATATGGGGRVACNMAYRASHLLIKYDGSTYKTSWRDPDGSAISQRTYADAAATLNSFLQELSVFNGADRVRKFDALAHEHSDCGSAKKCGDLGKLEPGVDEELEDTVQALAVGQLSGIVQTNSGLHIILRTSLDRPACDPNAPPPPPPQPPASEAVELGTRATASRGSESATAGGWLGRLAVARPRTLAAATEPAEMTQSFDCMQQQAPVVRLRTGGHSDTSDTCDTEGEARRALLLEAEAAQLRQLTQMECALAKERAQVGRRQQRAEEREEAAAARAALHVAAAAAYAAAGGQLARRQVLEAMEAEAEAMEAMEARRALGGHECVFMTPEPEPQPEPAQSLRSAPSVRCGGGHIFSRVRVHSKYSVPEIERKNLLPGSVQAAQLEPEPDTTERGSAPSVACGRGLISSRLRVYSTRVPETEREGLLPGSVHAAQLEPEPEPENTVRELALAHRRIQVLERERDAATAQQAELESFQTFYHGTSLEAGLAIQTNGFNVEFSGRNAGMVLGKGVYITTTLEKALNYAKPNPENGCVLELKVDLGRVYRLKGGPQKRPDDPLREGGWQRHYNACHSPAGFCGVREEHCVRDAARVHMVNVSLGHTGKANAAGYFVRSHKLTLDTHIAKLVAGAVVTFTDAMRRTRRALQPQESIPKGTAGEIVEVRDDGTRSVRFPAGSDMHIDIVQPQFLLLATQQQAKQWEAAKAALAEREAAMEAALAAREAALAAREAALAAREAELVVGKVVTCTVSIEGMDPVGTAGEIVKVLYDFEATDGSTRRVRFPAGTRNCRPEILKKATDQQAAQWEVTKANLDVAHAQSLAVGAAVTLTNSYRCHRTVGSFSWSGVKKTLAKWWTVADWCEGTFVWGNFYVPEGSVGEILPAYCNLY